VPRATTVGTAPEPVDAAAVEGPPSSNGPPALRGASLALALARIAGADGS